jgi:hypothetical protein
MLALHTYHVESDRSKLNHGSVFELELVYSANHGSSFELDVSCSIDLLIFDLLP